MTKLICVIGVTGNQGGSVAQRFLQDPNYRVRGITRNPDSKAARQLASQGIEIVKADLNDTESLIDAFRGANVIFSVTNYWEPFFRPDYRAPASASNISCRKLAYDVEYQQGKNIADAAAAVVDDLEDNGFLASTLSSARECSGGAFQELYHFDAKADVFPTYVREKYLLLARKMSLIQTGFFTSSYRYVPGAYFKKMPDGTFQMSFPTSPTAQIPHLEVNKDTGSFVHAVSQMPAGHTYMAEGTTCPWPEFLKQWGEVNKVPTRYQEITLEEFIAAAPDKEFGKEGGDMWAYSSDPGYDGGVGGILRKEDIEKAGIACPMTTIREYFEGHDWSSVLDQ